MVDAEVYKDIISKLIKKQMIMLGPNVALNTARKVAGITVADDGNIISMEGDPKGLMEGVTNQYMNLSGQIAQMTLKTILDDYPELSKEQSS